MSVAQQVRRLSSAKRANYHNPAPVEAFKGAQEADKNEFACELHQTRAELAERETALIRAKRWIEYLAERGVELERQVAREAPTSQISKEHAETLAAQFANAIKRIEELEGELGSARHELGLREADNRSLQTSLTLIVRENSRLSGCLMESEASVAEANQNRWAETKTLNTRLEAMSSRAVAAERSLAEVQQGLPASTDEKHAAKHKFVNGTDVSDAADSTLEQFRNSLMIKLPAEGLAQLNAEGALVEIHGEIGKLGFPRQYESSEHTLTRGDGEKARTNCVESRCEWNDGRSASEYSDRAKVRYTEMLLDTVLTS